MTLDTLDTLYKRSKTGKILYYSISTQLCSDRGIYSEIVKESGELLTKNPIIHKEVIKMGKNIGKANETTPEEQADLQMMSDWLKKKDEGYKSLKDLDITQIEQ